MLVVEPDHFNFVKQSCQKLIMNNSSKTNNDYSHINHSNGSSLSEVGDDSITTDRQRRWEAQNHRLNIFMIVRILFQYLEKVDTLMLMRAKEALKDFNTRKKLGDPEYQSLGHVIPEKMPAIVGQVHWSRAVDIHHRYLLNMQKKKRPVRPAANTHIYSTSGGTQLQSQIQQSPYSVPYPYPSPITSNINFGDLGSKQDESNTSLGENPVLSPFSLSSYTDIQDSFSLNHYPLHHHHYQIKPRMEDESKQTISLEDDNDRDITTSELDNDSTLESDNLHWASSMDEIPSIVRQTAETLLMVQKDTSSSNNNNTRIDYKS